MKRALTLFLILILLFTGCVSSETKSLVRNTLKDYFAFLDAGDFEYANAMTVQGDESISHEIEDISVNRLIFKGIEYELWNITEEDGYIIADVVVTQKSLQAAYIDTVREYAAYVENAKAQNKVFADSALEDKWNEIFYKYVADTSERTSIRCNIKMEKTAEGKLNILMDAEFRNALFGGELDAINALSKAS